MAQAHHASDQGVGLCQSDACREAQSHGSCAAAPAEYSIIEDVSAAEPLMKLPGLVARPLTLQQAVAEAITEAAYKQGSNDNLAAVVIDLVGPQRYAVEPSAQAGSNPPNEKRVTGDGIALEQQGLGDAADAMIPVPRRSTIAATSSLMDVKGAPGPLLGILFIHAPC